MLSLLPDDLSNVVIEITEHELASEDGSLEEGLARLRNRGARIAVDDAGAGYAGLNQIMRVQPEIIKLDRSLVEGVHADGAKAALIEFFVLFASRVGAKVCAEGIETVDELRAVVNLGVTFGQGYLLGRPSEPWATVPPEITRALGTGALRTHAAAARPSTPASPAVAAPAATTFGVPREQIYGLQRNRPLPAPPPPPAVPAGPVNRRLGRR
jgi:EAL domain-containing protein (putative c-di-GMP-specific phosphodiesterase class I)